MHVFFLNLPGILHLLLFFRLGAIGSQERGVWSKSLLWEPAPPTKKGKGKDCQDFLGWEKNEWDLNNQHRYSEVAILIAMILGTK